MVLPGIQALFGFQLIAVFSATFGERLSAGEQQLHLAATFLIAVAVAIIMAPAAYHRQAGPREVTETFVWLSTRLLLWSMWPLAVGVCLDFYLVSRVILHSAVAPVLAGGLFAIFLGLWFLLPRIRDPRRGSAVRGMRVRSGASDLHGSAPDSSPVSPARDRHHQ
jgi:hypothetical protein